MQEEHSGGFISLHRSILQWEWYEDIPTRCLFIHLLLTANFKDRRALGRTLRRGQRVCTIRSLAKETGLTERQTRTALEHLKATHEVTQRSTPQGTVITIKNYAQYQKPTQQPTHGKPRKIDTAIDTLSDTRMNPQTDCGSSGPRYGKRVIDTDNDTGIDIPPTHDRHTTSNKEIKKPPISPKGDEYSPDFLTFWSGYPKKVGKGAAWRAYQKVRPDRDLLEFMLKAVAVQRSTQAWTKDGGQYIPHPATWLNQRRWEDEPDEGGDDDDEGII